jgi:predicted nucleic acid-binding protein
VTGFLLDTNIPSELIRSQPEERVTDWVYRQAEESLFLSVVSIGELMRGFTLLPVSARRTVLETWFREKLVPQFQSRILPVTYPVTYAVAERWGVLDAQAQRKGRSVNTGDGLIVATALEHGLTLVTRNIRDFDFFDVQLLNPWAVQGGDARFSYTKQREST